MAECDKAQKKILAAFGEKLGLLFQIVDDILDVIKPIEKHGKPTSRDEEKGKKTYISLLGIHQAKEKAFDLFSSLKETLNKIDKDTSHLLQITNKIIRPLDL